MGDPYPLKGLVLIGGHGTRLRPLSHTTAKQLIPIANKPIAFYAVEALVAAGVTQIGLVTGDTRDEVIDALGDGSRFGACFTYIHQGEPLGIAHAVLTAREFIGASPFVLFLGDNLIPSGIQRHAASFMEARPDAQLLLKAVPNPQEFGIAILDAEGRPLRIIEKPSEPPSDLAVTGVYFFGPRFIDAASKIQPSARGELEITDAIQQMIDADFQVHATLLTEDWIDAGRPDDLLRANRMVLEEVERQDRGAEVVRSKLHGNVVLGARCRVVDSEVEGPAIIGDRTEVVSSRIGAFTSIGSDVQLLDTYIEDSIVLERARITHAGLLRRSLIGRDAHISGIDASAGISMVLGDDSRVSA